MLKGFVYPKLTKETQVGRIVIPSTNSDRTRNRWGVGVGSPDTIIEYDDIATDTSVDIYLKDAGTNGVYAGVPTGGFYQILSGSKLQLQKLATFSYPPSL